MAIFSYGEGITRMEGKCGNKIYENSSVGGRLEGGYIGDYPERGERPPSKYDLRIMYERGNGGVFYGHSAVGMFSGVKITLTNQ
jgi:hypothetical protein